MNMIWQTEYCTNKMLTVTTEQTESKWLFDRIAESCSHVIQHTLTHKCCQLLHRNIIELFYCPTSYIGMPLLSWSAAEQTWGTADIFWAQKFNCWLGTMKYIHFTWSCNFDFTYHTTESPSVKKWNTKLPPYHVLCVTCWLAEIQLKPSVDLARSYMWQNFQ